MKNWIKVPNINYEISEDCTKVRSLNYKKRGEPFVISGTTDKNGYTWFSVSINGGRRRIGLHHMSYMTFVDSNFLPSRELVLDHIDNDQSNNLPTNLQITSQRINSIKDKYNKKSSKYVGVCLHKRTGRYSAQIKYKGSKIHIGYFTDELEAYKSYKEKLYELTGVKLEKSQC